MAASLQRSPAMKRILFISIPEKGHLNPMIGPGVCLRDRGHTVAFFAGCNVAPNSAPPVWTQCLKCSHRNRLWPEPRARICPARSAPRLASRLDQAILVEEAEEQIEPLRKVIRNFQPDVVMVNPMIYAAIIAAHEEQIPWVPYRTR